MMSMASSVEVRVPYLCRDIIELARAYRPGIRTEADLKRPLKEVFGRCYPGGSTFRRKIGFTLPMAKLLQGPLRDDVIRCTTETPVFGSEVLDVRQVAAFVQAYYQRAHSAHQAVWHLYAWQKWAIANELTA
jgi:asparagine synthase (glutamine-hydrolysing)